MDSWEQRGSDSPNNGGGSDSPNKGPASLCERQGLAEPLPAESPSPHLDARGSAISSPFCRRGSRGTETPEVTCAPPPPLGSWPSPDRRTKETLSSEGALAQAVGPVLPQQA